MKIHKEETKKLAYTMIDAETRLVSMCSAHQRAPTKMRMDSLDIYLAHINQHLSVCQF